MMRVGLVPKMFRPGLWLCLLMFNPMILFAIKIDLPKLPYDQKALEPVISTRTIEFHYGKHHAGYVTNLNNLIVGTPYEGMTLEQIVREADKNKATAIFNNAAQIWNHTFYFESLGPNPKAGIAKVAPPVCENQPKGILRDAIVERWGSYEAFVKEFEMAGTTLFGSGWVWLVKTPSPAGFVLDIIKEPNAGTPITKGMTPLLVADVWEHAYYLDYQNRRADYLKSFWCIVNWSKVEARYAEQGIK
jgi:Fe-Mn family superoxide dismutase